MAPPKNGRRRAGTPPQATAIVDSVNRLVEAVTGLIGSISHAAAGAAVSLRGVAPQALAHVPAAIAQKSERLRKSIKAHWASMSPAEREARIRRMLAGRGLKRKPAAARASAGRGGRRARRGRPRKTA